MCYRIFVLKEQLQNKRQFNVEYKSTDTISLPDSVNSISNRIECVNRGRYLFFLKILIYIEIITNFDGINADE
jgi:hypothetical protein